MPVSEIVTQNIARSILPNGVRVITETVPGARTVAIGLWVACGSRHDPLPDQGITHLIEHMFFKGTASKTAQAIALEMNALGGHFNAFTTQESVCIHARVIDDHLDKALRLIADMYLNSTYDEEELSRERSVILEEIKMTNDTPDELIHDLFQETLWGNHGLGRSILGTEDSVSGISRQAILDHMQREFSPGRIVISAAGAVNHEQLADQVGELLGNLNSETFNPALSPAPDPIFERRHLERDLEQTHFCLGCVGPSRTAGDRHAVNLLSSILGGGASSRIFQEIRERRGLAYSIGTFLSPHVDTGCFGVGGGTSPEHLAEVIDLSLLEIRKVCESPVPEDELRNAKDQLHTHLLLSLESMNHRMSRLAEVEIHFDRFITLEETLAHVEAVTSASVLEAARRHFDHAPLAAVSIGPGSSPTRRVPTEI